MTESVWRKKKTRHHDNTPQSRIYNVSNKYVHILITDDIRFIISLYYYFDCANAHTIISATAVLAHIRNVHQICHKRNSIV